MQQWSIKPYLCPNDRLYHFNVQNPVWQLFTKACLQHIYREEVGNSQYNSTSQIVQFLCHACLIHYNFLHTSTFSSTSFLRFICLFMHLFLITIAQPCIKIVRLFTIFLMRQE